MPERTLLLVHALAPPTPGGTPVVLRRLLEGLPGYGVEVVTDRALRQRVRDGAPGTLDAPYRYFGRLRPAARRLPGLAALVDLLNVPLAVAAGIRAAVAARSAGASHVLSPFDGGFSQIAGAVAARLSGRPLVAMVFDLWDENAYPPVQRALGRRLEGRIMRAAAAVVVYCPAAAEHYEGKHGVRCTVIDTPIEAPGPAPEAAPADPGEVLVAGAVYWAQEDAVARLLAAARAVPEATVAMVGDEAGLRRRGLDADRYEPQLPAADFARRAAAAGVLFVGLSLRSPHPDVVRTATPARLAEYMGVGRPLLVHAPRGAHVAEYARDEDFAAVVDEPDEQALASALRRILDEPEEAAARTARARALAAERHTAEHVRTAFARVLDAAAR